VRVEDCVSEVFVSYDRKSRALAEPLVKDIRALGHHVWFDQELTGGQRWWDHILARILACDVFVYALTPHSLASTACQREQGYASALGKTILPVVTADGISTNVLPPALAQLELLDYRSRDRDSALRLARAVAALPPSKPLPEPLPTSPEVPSSYLGGIAERLATASPMDYGAQSALLIDLKRGLRDPETANDARTLLQELRKRGDLLAAIADEIDEVLEPAPRPSLHPGYESILPAQPGTVPSPPDQAPRWRERLLAAFVSGVLATAFGNLLILSIEGLIQYRQEWGIAFFTGIGAAAAGAVAGKRRRVLLPALIGAAASWLTILLIGIITSEKMSASMLAGGVLIAPLGAVLGAVSAAIYLRWRRTAQNRAHKAAGAS
jgi:hypothetical protein